MPLSMRIKKHLKTRTEKIEVFKNYKTRKSSPIVKSIIISN